MTQFAIAALPLLLLLVSLLLGRYPGCEAALRLADRLASCAHDVRTPTVSWRRSGRPVSRMPHGGLLLAFGLAQRPPPLAT